MARAKINQLFTATGSSNIYNNLTPFNVDQAYIFANDPNTGTVTSFVNNGSSNTAYLGYKLTPNDASWTVVHMTLTNGEERLGGHSRQRIFGFLGLFLIIRPTLSRQEHIFSQLMRGLHKISTPVLD